jgi:Flp pilus assembly protein TadG
MSTFMASGLEGHQSKSGDKKLARPVLSQFKNDRKGEVALTFSMTAIVMLMTIGAAVDVGRWIHVSRQSQQALDSAVLAGAQVLRSRGTNAPGAVALAMKTAQAFYRENASKRTGLKQQEVEFQLSADRSGFTGAFTAQLDTSMLKIANMVGSSQYDQLAVKAKSEAAISVGANADSNVEVSIMLDTSGSMIGDKFDDMQTAAKALVNAVVWADQSEFTSKVAIAPFSGDVLLPAAWNLAVRGPADITTQYTCGTRSSPRLCTTVARADPCVVERHGAQAATDVAPGVGTYVTAKRIRNTAQSARNATVYPPAPTNAAPTTCNQMQTAGSYVNSVMALTNNVGDLEDKIDDLVIGTGTAGHIGTAWAWYTLSPNWNSVTGVTAAPYSDTNTHKYAVLMTDGQYNIWHDADGSRNDDSSDTASNRAIAICEGMKDAGITVYTVGFDIADNQDAIDTLAACATSPSHAYVADDGDALISAFQDIGSQLVQLHLRK